MKKIAEEEPVVVIEPTVTEPEPMLLKPEVVESKKDNGNWWMLPLAFVLGVLVGGMSMYLFRSQKPVEVAPVVAATPAPTPTPEVLLKRSDLKIQVLNGSGVTGAASKAKDYLEGLGYVDVATGNADDKIDTTQVALKLEKKAYFDLVKKDLDSKYTVDNQPQTLSVSSDYDVVITLGTK